MADRLVRNETPAEYFREQVERACGQIGLQPHPATTYYVVGLLAAFAHRDTSPAGRALAADEPLGLMLLKALDRGGADARTHLRQVGDLALFVSGFFSDHLHRQPVDVDYYRALGGVAYGYLGHEARDPLHATYEELSEKFGQFVDVLTVISERSLLTRDADLLRLYDRWARTGSRRDGERLVARGLLPSSPGSRRVQ